MFDDFVGKQMTGGQKPEQREEQEAAQERTGAGGDLLGGLLGGMLGGQGGDLGTLLGASGDEGAAAPGGLGSMLGGLLGGGSQADPSFLGNNAMANPLVDILADKLGVSKQTAGMIVSVAVPLVIGMLQKQRGEGSRGATRSGGLVDAADLNRLHDPDYLRSSGAVSQVASQTDMDEDEAAQRLQEAMDLLIGQAP
jgi:hypothetical protein